MNALSSGALPLLLPATMKRARVRVHMCGKRTSLPHAACPSVYVSAATDAIHEQPPTSHVHCCGRALGTHRMMHHVVDVDFLRFGPARLPLPPPPTPRALSLTSEAPGRLQWCDLLSSLSGSNKFRMNRTACRLLHHHTTPHKNVNTQSNPQHRHHRLTNAGGPRRCPASRGLTPPQATGRPS